MNDMGGREELSTSAYGSMEQVRLCRRVSGKEVLSPPSTPLYYSSLSLLSAFCSLLSHFVSQLTCRATAAMTLMMSISSEHFI